MGLHDYNSSFYSLDSAGLFTHPSFGIGPETAQVGPSIFATTALALHLSLQLDDQYLLLAIYDGVPGDPDHTRGTHIKLGDDDGWFSAVEWGFVQADNYKLALGAWQHTALVENPVSGAMSDHNTGVYVIGEKYLNDTLALFAQLGQADTQSNQIEHYAGAGVVFSDIWQIDDSLGIAAAHARNGAPFLAGNPELLSAETAWELSYFTPVTDFLSLQASFYYLQQPGMSQAVDDAVALGARAYFEF